jgi:hypothetical protein
MRTGGSSAVRQGKLRQPGGRPRGIPNPKRRVPNLVARPLSAQALSDLIDRRPYLLRPLALFGADPNAISQLDKHLGELLATKI